MIGGGFDELGEAEVVGVTKDPRSAASPGESQEAFFLPFGSVRMPFFTIMVRTGEFDRAVADRIREAVENILPGHPVPEPTPLTERVRRIHSERRIFGRLLVILAITGPVLTVVGLYGVIATSVAGRVRECGIRLALGAGRDRIAALVLRHAAGIMAAGVGAGLVGAYLLSSVLESRLFGIGRLDAVVRVRDRRASTWAVRSRSSSSEGRPGDGQDLSSQSRVGPG